MVVVQEIAVITLFAWIDAPVTAEGKWIAIGAPATSRELERERNGHDDYERVTIHYAMTTGSGGNQGDTEQVHPVTDPNVLEHPSTVHPKLAAVGAGAPLQLSKSIVYSRPEMKPPDRDTTVRNA